MSNHSPLRSVVLLACLAGASHCFAEDQPAATFFVAPGGNDAWSGRLSAPNPEKTDGPFATVAKARNAVRQLKQQGELKKPVTVMVRGGKYFLKETLVLSAEDSGSRRFPTTYTAYPGEKPILSGGRVVTGWRPYRDKILQCELPGAKGGKWKFRQLFLDGRRQIRSRTPNFDPKNPLKGGWAIMEGPAEPGSLVAFQYKPNTFNNHWAKPTQAEVNVFPGDCGVNSIIPIKTLDENTRVITLAHATINQPLPGIRQEYSEPPPSSFWGVFFPQCGAFRPGNRFYVANLLEELDQPGEWCVDTDEGKLYFWPPAGSLANAQVVAPRLGTLVDLSGSSFLQISGFTFTETAGGDNYLHGGGRGYGPMFPQQGLRYCGDAVHLKRAENCIVENCKFDALGGNGVYLEGYNARNLIRHNTIGNVGACGVGVLGSREANPVYNRIEDNHIHHTGVYSKFSAGVFLGCSGGNFINHNLIEHTPHHAINLGSNLYGRNFIEYNEIRHACEETHDTAAINCWMEVGGANGRNVQRQGHLIRYNLIVDSHERAIYLDNDTSNCVVHGNVIVRAPTYVITVHGGQNNVIENNVIVDASPGPAVALYDYLTPELLRANTVRRNIFVNVKQPIRVTHHQGPDYILAQSDYNLFFNVPGGESFLKGRQQAGYDVHSLVADPLFVDAAHDDYRLKPESPALKLGFQPINMDGIGIRTKTPE